ncbi:MAG TPA: hypothetical protein PLD62_01925 [Candidatus Cloacimonadota bacterium]|nr:hypothetical protein [Candidatus Cloacimonadota bacterium]
MNFLKISFVVIIALLLFCCGDTTSPTQGDFPSDVKVEKVSAGMVRISWVYNNTGEDTLQFILGAKKGSDGWDEYYAVVHEDTYEYFDYIPTSDSLIYAYKVRYYNINTGLYSQFSEADAYLSANTAPTEFNVQTNTQQSVTLTWHDRCVGEEGYYIDKKIGNGSWDNNYFKLDADIETITDTATLFDTIYYRVSAYFGDSSSATVQDSIFQTLLAPSQLGTTILDVNKIRLDWTDNSSGEAGFSIDRKVGGSDWNTVYATVDSNLTTYVDDVEYPCATLCYRVRAFQDSLYSLYSPIDTININLQIVGSVNTPGSASEVFFADWYAFVSDGYSGLEVIDCSQPNAPALLGNYQTLLPDRTISSYIKNNIAYVATHSTVTNPGRIHLLDISNLLEPVMIGFTDTEGIPQHIFVSGDYAYIAEGEAGLSIIYIAGSNLHTVSNFQLDDARSVFVKDNFAFVAEGLEGLKIFDVLDTSNPELLGELSTSGSMLDVYVLDDFAYLADGENGMKIIDISDAENPTVYSRISTNGFVYGVWAEADYAYFVDKEKGFYVVDTSNLQHPEILGNIEMDSEPVSINVSGSYAYVTDNEGLKIIQVKP